MSWGQAGGRRRPATDEGNRRAGDPARAAHGHARGSGRATVREQEVFALLAEGLADKETSRRLFISERTVHHHVSSVLSKIGVSSRTAAGRAAEMGIGAPS